MTESLYPRFQAAEDIEVERIDLPAAYAEGVPESVKEQMKDSWGPEGRGWKLLGGTALVLVITAVGAEYYRRKYGEEE